MRFGIINKNVLAVLLSAISVFTISASASAASPAVGTKNTINQKINSIMVKKNLLADNTVWVDTSIKDSQIECLWMNKSRNVYLKLTAPDKKVFSKVNCAESAYDDSIPGRIAFSVPKTEMKQKGKQEPWKIQIYTTLHIKAITWFSDNKKACKTSEANFYKLFEKEGGKKK